MLLWVKLFPARWYLSWDTDPRLHCVFKFRSRQGCKCCCSHRLGTIILPGMISSSNSKSVTSIFNVFIPTVNTSLNFCLQKHLAADDSGWPQGMLDHIRNSDETVLKGCDKARFLFCYHEMYLFLLCAFWCRVLFGRFCPFTRRIFYLQSHFPNCLMWQVCSMWF